MASIDGLSPAMGDSWASIANTPVLPMFQKLLSFVVNNNNDATGHGQTVDLSTTKSNNLYGGGNVPCLDGGRADVREEHDTNQLNGALRVVCR